MIGCPSTKPCAAYVTTHGLATVIVTVALCAATH
jgi:hypothetical protein